MFLLDVRNCMVAYLSSGLIINLADLFEAVKSLIYANL